ncbi:Rv3654c family TadE-like protein [Kribbella sp. CA-293567]|uniref:Rv3654c family TadE-like protein n=1 Tax=Kribbella sp. CA-293567 TaxID=3002436 RepID=UPI003FA60DB3
MRTPLSTLSSLPSLMPTQPTDDRGSASLLAIGITFVLLGGCLVGVLWAAVSVGHHRADAAADLAALSAAQALQISASGSATTVGACAAAAQVASAQQVELRDCQLLGETVTILVAVELQWGMLGTPVLTAEARAGPMEGAN